MSVSSMLAPEMTGESFASLSRHVVLPETDMYIRRYMFKCSVAGIYLGDTGVKGVTFWGKEGYKQDLAIEQELGVLDMKGRVEITT